MEGFQWRIMDPSVCSRGVKNCSSWNTRQHTFSRSDWSSIWRFTSLFHYRRRKTNYSLCQAVNIAVKDVCTCLSVCPTLSGSNKESSKTPEKTERADDLVAPTRRNAFSSEIPPGAPWLTSLYMRASCQFVPFGVKCVGEIKIYHPHRLLTGWDAIPGNRHRLLIYSTTLKTFWREGGFFGSQH